MTPRTLRIVVGAVAVVVAVVVAVDAGLPPGPTVELAALGVAVAVALLATSRLPTEVPDALRRLAPAAHDDSPTPVEVLRSQLEAAVGTAAGAHFVLAPTLRELARHRCRRHGVALTDEPRARALLGDELFALVRPGRDRPTDRDALGTPVPVLRAAVDRLEAL